MARAFTDAVWRSHPLCFLKRLVSLASSERAHSSPARSRGAACGETLSMSPALPSPGVKTRAFYLLVTSDALDELRQHHR